MNSINLYDMDNEHVGPAFPDMNDKTYFDIFKESLKRSWRGILWFFLFLVYEETIFHFWAFDGISLYFLLKIFMCLPTAVILSFFVSFGGRKVNKVVTWVLTALLIILYCVEVLYHQIFKVFFSIEFIDKNNAKIVQYYREIIQGIKDNALMLLAVILVPVIALILLNVFRVFKYKPMSVKCIYIPVVYLAVVIGLTCLIVPLYGDDDFSAYDLMKYENTTEYSFEKLGAVCTSEIQVRNLIFPRSMRLDDEDLGVWVYNPDDNKEPEGVDVSGDVSGSDVSGSDAEIIQEIVKKIDTSPNILDIDFVSLAENETNEDVAAIHKYFASVEPSYKNEYTGMFKGFNLIFLTAEGFSRMAVDEKHTPTLYRLVNEGFVFENFYNPRTGGSTSDGEFVCSTSLVPTNGGAKNFKIVGQNCMPFSLGNTFNRTYGITSRAYHDNDYEYYGRDITYPGMGYYYQGVGNGVVVGKHWPESDLEMMQSTLNEYIDDDLFNIYYMTVSGHLNYNFAGNYCAKIHYDDVQDLPYSEPCKAYIACNMELDLAMQYLIEQLEEKGIADRTVICFTGDHWPYGLTNDEISEILGHPVEENFELYKSNLILWSGAIKEPIHITKQCCSMDIVPTLMNLFGLDYDSRLFMGRDILSDTEGFIIFINRSYITDKVMYNSQTKEYTYLTDEIPDEEYLKNCKRTLNNRWAMSQKIMDTDYYKYIADALGIEVKTVEQNYTPDYSKFTK
ncbi:MAG: sulfatase-like hydrolase/transferase [Lachnospiraceae bacterium]|nr:sulfatase-like hydrolase/transferase [Lachnospiraceae bacterium]